MNSREQFDRWVIANPKLGATLWDAWQASRACATPEWEHAPDWANWLAMNPDGYWYWFAAQPEQRLTQWWNPWGTQVKDAGLTPGRSGWTETLEQRP